MPFLFGYGSLLDQVGFVPSRRPHPAAFVADLPGYRRRFDVAMDNSVDLPGYKYFIDGRSGERPAVSVAFLNLVPAPASAVNGVLFRVDEHTLAALDSRERNYRRIVVEPAAAQAAGDLVFTYVGTTAARRRHEAASAAGTAVVARAYIDAVRAGFAALGRDELAAFDHSTDAPAVPVRDLIRRDLR